MPRRSKEQLIAELEPQLQGVTWILAPEHNAIRREYLHRKALTAFWADFYGVPVDQFTGWRDALRNIRSNQVRPTVACSYVSRSGKQCDSGTFIHHPKAYYPGYTDRCGKHPAPPPSPEMEKYALIYRDPSLNYSEEEAHVIAYGTEAERHAVIHRKMAECLSRIAGGRGR